VTNAREVFVSLLDEGVDVWRPVQAEHMRDNIYRIANQPYEKDIETWQFVPGDEVICEMIDSSEGRIFAATRKP
jgi:hypothetical protein